MRKNAIAHDHSRSSRPLLGSFLLIFCMFYIGFHAVSGERGVFALFKESRRLEELQVRLAEVTAEHDALAHKVRLLSDSSLDLDMLDEQARRVLGRANGNEVVYFTAPQPK